MIILYYYSKPNVSMFIASSIYKLTWDKKHFGTVIDSPLIRRPLQIY